MTSVLSLLNKMPLSEEYVLLFSTTFISLNAQQRLNAPPDISVTPSGTVTLSRPIQYSNEEGGISVRPFPKVTLFRF